MPVENTYTIIATDGNQYGPITLAQLQAGIQEVRVAPDTQILRSDLNQWHPAAHYKELNLTAPLAAPGAVRVTLAQPAASATPTNPVYAPDMASPPEMANSGELMELDKKIRNHGSWYFWIAGLTLVNTITSLSGSGGAFLLGLSITQVFDGFGTAAGGGGKMVALFLDAMAIGMFTLFGVFALKRHNWAFIVGIILYGLDTLLTLFFQSWLSLAFHAWALFSLIAGMRSCFLANKLTRPS